MLWSWEEARAHFHNVDPSFHEVIRSLPDPDIAGGDSAFLSLARAIVGQQLSTQAAATIWTRFCALHEDGLDAGAVLAAHEEDHRSVGISRQKHGYLTDLALHYLDNPGSFDLVSDWSDEEIIASWTRVKGLGRWTVQMHLMFALNRPDVFAPDDLGIRRSMEKFLGIPKDAAKSVYEKRALVWGPFRTAACRFLWNALSNQPK